MNSRVGLLMASKGNLRQILYSTTNGAKAENTQGSETIGEKTINPEISYSLAKVLERMEELAYQRLKGEMGDVKKELGLINGKIVGLEGSLSGQIVGVQGQMNGLNFKLTVILPLALFVGGFLFKVIALFLFYFFIQLWDYFFEKPHVKELETQSLIKTQKNDQTFNGLWNHFKEYVSSKRVN